VRSLFGDTIDRFTRVGLLARSEKTVCLTEAGLSVADALASEFLAAATGNAATA
jgi:hypothetical protein